MRLLLCERPEDIPQLARHILDQLARQSGFDLPELTAAALQKLEQYDYPGNVRELENILVRAFTLCEGERLDADDLSLPEQPHADAPPRPGNLPLEDQMEELERQAIT